MLEDLETGTTGSTPTYLTAVGSRVVFSSETTGAGRELWSTDGTPAGTILPEDHEPGPGDSDPLQLTPFQGEMLYTTDAFSTRSLHFTDGTVAGTQVLVDVPQAIFVSGVVPPIVPAGDVA